MNFLSSGYKKLKYFPSNREYYQFCPIKSIKDLIGQNLSIIEIFKIFESNKMILLFLLEEKIITINETIYFEIINQSKKKKKIFMLKSEK